MSHLLSTKAWQQMTDNTTFQTTFKKKFPVFLNTVSQRTRGRCERFINALRLMKVRRTSSPTSNRTLQRGTLTVRLGYEPAISRQSLLQVNPSTAAHYPHHIIPPDRQHCPYRSQVQSSMEILFSCAIHYCLLPGCTNV